MHHNLFLLQEDTTRIDDISKSSDRASTELEDTKDELTTAKEEHAPDTQPPQPGDNDKPDTRSNMEEVITLILCWHNKNTYVSVHTKMYIPLS